MPCSFTTAPPLSEGGHLRRNVVSFGEIERGGLILVVLGEIDRPMCRWVMPVGVRSGGKITGNGCVLTTALSSLADPHSCLRIYMR